MGLIYHISPREELERAEAVNAYWGDSLEKDGFIHCSTGEQIVRVANRFYAGRSGLVLMVIDEDKVDSEIRYEASEGTERFPHIYGPLNLDALIQVRDFPPLADGTFVFDLNQ